MENPQIWFDENEKVTRLNDSAKSLVGDREINEIEDIFGGIVSLRLFNEKEMKVPFITEDGKELTKIKVMDENGTKKVIIPIEYNKWITNYLSDVEIKETNSEIKETSYDRKKTALNKIGEIEEELKQSTDFDAERTLIFNFKSTEEYNEFSDSLQEKDNVEIEDTDQMEDQILAVVKITSPTRKWI